MTTSYPKKLVDKVIELKRDFLVEKGQSIKRRYKLK